MKHVMVRYKVKPGRADENQALIEAVFRQLAAERPAGLRYSSFELDDGISFVHLASIDTPDGSNPLTALSAFGAFTAEIRERCDEPPATTTLHAIGSYDATR